MIDVIRNTILSCQYKTLSPNKLVHRKVHFFFAFRNKKYALGETAKINTFTVYIFHLFSPLGLASKLTT